MPRRTIHWLVASVLIVFAAQVSGVAGAEKRVALVIGNSAYQHVPRLQNPVNDASDIRTKLDALGFQIFGGADLDRTKMISALTGFGRAAENADVALVFYAGHGLQVNGQNYLVPVDANVEYEAELDIALVPFSIVMQQLARGSRINIALLDACRDNPFSQGLSRSMGTRAVGALGRGLSRVNSAAGTFIAYATAPDNVAQDGTGRNSPFTAAMLKFIDRPGLSLSDMMIEVRNDVIQSTNGKQVPWDTSSLTGRFSFKIEGTVTVTPPPQGSTGPQTSPPPPDRAALELETWKRIRESGNAAVFQQFLEHYPDGIFAQLARDRVAALSIKSEPSAAPPVQGICWTGRNGQFFRAIHYCVSSVLAPQGGNTYGPEHLARWEGNSTKAWCEGVPGHGIGDTVTIRIEGAVAFRRLLVANGYGKSSRTYANNGRVKTVEITADTGIRAMQNFPDRSDILPIDLPKLAQHWIQLKIVDVYPGQRFTDTCLSFLMPDHEYEEKLLLKEQGLLPK